MAILHIVLAKIDDSCLKESREDVYRQIHLLLDAIPVPKHDVRVGPPLNPSTTGGYDIMLAMTFDKPQDFNAYLVHPKHLQILKRYGPPVFKDMIAYQADGSAPKSKL
ncbi:hypothetical protein L227DRAFT_188490 [Lentinus tigrinus ALCF2SS1-6]|uniref:Stress-response A/B barrel domain-containing protein n=1 Tax=Lentinus tigrinus ALCF2SS1-6 TaxID=1328759 RepID=A0A5C2SAW9_9APHY|nr:hypothetical protein L227DRAFT_188490 [Lentinus tigrinus ALCF2SS1-6]